MGTPLLPALLLLDTVLRGLLLLRLLTHHGLDAFGEGDQGVLNNSRALSREEEAGHFPAQRLLLLADPWHPSLSQHTRWIRTARRGAHVRSEEVGEASWPVTQGSRSGEALMSTGKPVPSQTPDQAIR